MKKETEVWYSEQTRNFRFFTFYVDLENPENVHTTFGSGSTLQTHRRALTEKSTEPLLYAMLRQRTKNRAVRKTIPRQDLKEELEKWRRRAERDGYSYAKHITEL